MSNRRPFTLKYILCTRIFASQLDIHRLYNPYPAFVTGSRLVAPRASAAALVTAYNVPACPRLSAAAVLGCVAAGCIVAGIGRCGTEGVEDGLEAGPHDDERGGNDGHVHFDDDDDVRVRDDGNNASYTLEFSF